jgi:hypothetical protein
MIVEKLKRVSLSNFGSKSVFWKKRDFLVETDLNFWQIIWFKNWDLCHKNVGTLGRWNFGKVELWRVRALV